MWERYMYDTSILEPLVDTFEIQRRHYAHNYTVVQNILRHEEKKQVECNCIAHMISYKYMSLMSEQLLTELVYALLDYLDELPILSISQLIWVTCSIIRMEMPHMTMINHVLFDGHMQDTLEISRTQRVDVVTDKKLFMYLNMCYSNSGGELIDEEVFSSWLHKGMKCKSVKREFKGHGKLIKYYEKCLKGLKWRKKRKRKREGKHVQGTCGVCFEEGRVLKTICGHEFCDTCITAWGKPTCPSCRRYTL